VAELRSQRLSAPVRGYNTQTTYLDIPDQQCAELINARLDLPDHVEMRGAINGIVQYDATAGRLPVGAVAHGGYILTGSATAYARNVFGEQPIEADVVPNNIRIDPASQSFAAMTGAFGTTKGFCPANQRYVRLGDLTYYLTVLTAATAARIVAGSESINSRRVGSWDGTNAGTPIIARNTGPMYGVDITAYADRLWVLGGTVPNAAAGAGVYSSSALYYSDPGGPVTDTLTLWQDDVSGIANQINVGDRDQDDYGVGVCPISNGLAVFKRNSIWVLRGNGPQTFQIRLFSRDVGCVSTESIVPYRDGCIFQSDSAFYYFDGHQLREIAMGQSWRGFQPVRVTPLPNDYFQLGIDRMLYMPTDGLTSMSVNSAVMGFDRRAARASGRYPVVVDGNGVFDFSAVVGATPYLTALYGQDKATNGTFYGTTFRLVTRASKLSGPMLSSQMSRVVVDATFRRNDEAAGTVAIAGYDPYTFTAAEQVTNSTIPLDVRATTNSRILNRTTMDVKTEADSYSLTIAFTCPAQMSVVSVGDIHVEFQPSRASRTRAPA